MSKRILIIDDDPLIRKILDTELKSLGYETILAEDGETGIKLLHQNEVDLVFCDIFMPKMDGFAVLQYIKKNFPEDLLVIIMTAYANMETAVKALEYGAFDYLIKPFAIEEIPYLLNRTFKFQNFIRKEKKQIYKIEYEFEEIIGISKYIKDLKQKLNQIIKNRKPVLILGENGTGKKFIAKIIAKYILQKENIEPVIVNLESYSTGSFETLFFSEKNIWEKILNNLLVIENIDRLNPQLQKELVKIINENKWNEKILNTVFVFTSRRIKTIYEIKYYIIDELVNLFNDNVIWTQKLSQHKEDIPLYIDFFIKKFNQNFNKNVKDVDKTALFLLMYYYWPSNLSELENAIEYAVSHSKNDIITPDCLPLYVHQKKDLDVFILNPQLKYKDALRLARDEIDRYFIKSALEFANNNKIKASKILGISIRQLYYKIKKLGI